MKLPSKYVEDPGFYQKPEAEQVQLLSAESQEFAFLPPQRQSKILSTARRMYGTSKVEQAPPGAPEGMLESAGKDLSIGFRGGVADIGRTVANIEGMAGLKDWSEATRKWSQGVAPKPEETAGRESVTSQVLQGIGAAPATIAKYAPAELAGPYAPLAAGAIGALSRMDEGPKAAVTEGAKDVLTFGLLGKAGKLPTRTGRAAASAAVAGGTTAAFEGGDIRKTTAATLMGGGFGALSGGEPKPVLTREEAKSMLEGGMTAFGAAKDRVRRYIAPQNRGPEARKTAGSIRAHGSETFRHADIAEYALREASKELSKLPDEQRLKLINSIETGKTAEEFPQYKPFVDEMRRIHNDVLGEMINEGRTPEGKATWLKNVDDAMKDPDSALKSYYLNYFPHLFKDPEAAQQLLVGYYAGKRPMEGPATFLHERTHPTIDDALYKKDESGRFLVDETGSRIRNENIQLVTTDPVEAYMLKWREMKRFTSAQRVLKDLKNDQLVEFVPSDKPYGPKGYVRLNDKTFKVYQKGPKGGTSIAGYYYAPEPVARVVNNYLSPGLRQYAPTRNIMMFNNYLNQSQLGLSAFHLGFTSVDAVISRFALGLEQSIEGVRRGDPRLAGKGAISIGKAAIAPVALVENMRTGSRMMREWRKPGSTDPQTAQLVQAMQEAGGGMSLDPVYRTDMTRKVKEIFRNHEGYAKLVYRLPIAGMEKFANLIMNHFVPMQKLGVFADLARFELDRLQPGYTQAQMREVMGRAWDSVDNRMGMLRYDNLFWEKWIKDVSMMTVRSVGWNLGTWRELGGGAMDWGALAKKGRKEFTHRMAYTIAMPAVTAMMGTMAHKLYTGEWPQDMTDMFFPKTGRKDEFGRDERISIPSYIKDMYHWYQRPGVTAAGKLHSSVWTIADMLQNRDFYNTEIAHKDDPLIKKAFDYTTFLAKQYTPFSWSNIARQRRLGMPVGQEAATFFGFIPAPADIKKTKAEIMATEIMADRLPKRASTKEEREHQLKRSELERKIRTGDDWQTFARNEIEGGGLAESDIEHAADRASGLPLTRSFQRMPIEDAIRVFRVAGKQEKESLLPILREKVSNNIDRINSLPQDRRQRISRQLLEILESPQAAATPPGVQ